jgi:DNA-binding response OmpR family regulator
MVQGRLIMETIIVSTDPTDRDYLAYVLRQAGLSVSQRNDLKGVTQDWIQKPAALVIAIINDTESAKRDVRSLRGVSEVPLIILGEMLTESDCSALLSSGADLVMPLPIGPRLLASYCHALLRRAKTMPLLALPALDLGSIALNPSTRTVHVEGKTPQRLTQLEFQLLYVLITNRGLAIPNDVIVERVWGYSERGNRELVRGLISRLRAKIEADPANPTFIHTIPGIGYLFDLEAP